MVWASDEKRIALCRKEGNGNESTREKQNLREDGWKNKKDR